MVTSSGRVFLLLRGAWGQHRVTWGRVSLSPRRAAQSPWALCGRGSQSASAGSSPPFLHPGLRDGAILPILPSGNPGQGWRNGASQDSAGGGGPLPVRLSAAGPSQRKNQLQGRPGAHRQPYTGRAGGLSGNLLLISPEASPGAMRILVGAGASSRALVGEACRTETPEAGRTRPGHSAPCGSGEGLGCRRRSPHAA